MGSGRATAYYTLARLAVFVILGAILYFVGLRGLLLIAVDAVLSGVLSYVLLARQREAMATAFQQRLDRRKERSAQLRRPLDEDNPR